MPITQYECQGCENNFDVLCEQGCERCENCCSCERCESCDILLKEENKCRDCCRCKQCCRCFHCSQCDRIAECECECCGYGIDCCCDCSYCESCCSNHDRGTCTHCGYCIDCCDCSQIDYMDHPIIPSEFWRATNLKQFRFNPSKRFIGVEIEVAVARDDKIIYEICNKWKCSIGEDGSLPDTGFEIRTYPAQGDVFCDLINDVCRALKDGGAKVNNSCGLHAHFSADTDSYWDIRKIVRLYAYLENALFSLVPDTRRDNRYCYPCGNKYLSHLHNLKSPVFSNPFSLKKKNKEKARYIRHNVPMMLYGDTNTRRTRTQDRPNCRYAALNIHSWFFRKTIENRLHAGTVNANKIICWSTLFAAILDRANQMSEKEIISLKRKPMEFLMEIAPNDTVRNYIKTRYIKCNPNKSFEEML